MCEWCIFSFITSLTQYHANKPNFISDESNLSCCVAVNEDFPSQSRLSLHDSTDATVIEDICLCRQQTVKQRTRYWNKAQHQREKRKKGKHRDESSQKENNQIGSFRDSAMPSYLAKSSPMRHLANYEKNTGRTAHFTAFKCVWSPTGLQRQR